MLPALHFLFHQFYKLKLSFCLFTQHQIQPPNNAVFRPLPSFLILHDRFPPPSEFHNNLFLNNTSLQARTVSTQ